MSSSSPRPSRSSRREPEFGRKVGAAISGLVNPVDLFSGAKQEDALIAENVVIFKRTSAGMLKPHGVTHNYHHRFELVIPLRTAGRIHVDGTGYSLAPGQVFLIFPHQFHHYLEIESEEIVWLFITFELAKPELLQSLRNSPRMIGAAEENFLEVMMKEHLAPARGPKRGFQVIVKVSELLQRLLAARPAERAVSRGGAAADPKGAILESINRYVRAHINRPLTIADLAKHTGYSISHLRAVFRRELGISLGGYMRDSRLSLAAAMLTDPDRGSIQSIAEACGFVSIFAFSRAFKKAKGVSPSVYRTAIKEGSVDGIRTSRAGAKVGRGRRPGGGN